jgi:hypothetical protein
MDEGDELAVLLAGAGPVRSGPLARKAESDYPKFTGAGTIETALGPLYFALRRNHLGPREVRVGDVRFDAHYGLKSDIAPCPKSAAISGLMHRSNLTAYSITSSARPSSDRGM